MNTDHSMLIVEDTKTNEMCEFKSYICGYCGNCDNCRENYDIKHKKIPKKVKRPLEYKHYITFKVTKMNK